MTAYESIAKLREAAEKEHAEAGKRLVIATAKRREDLRSMALIAQTRYAATRDAHDADLRLLQLDQPGGER